MPTDEERKKTAAYMRDYRARVKAANNSPAQLLKAASHRFGDGQGAEYIAKMERRIAEQDEEIRHLKAELAKRITGATPITRLEVGSEPPPSEETRRRVLAAHPYNSRPFTPTPKVQPKRSAGPR